MKRCLVPSLLALVFTPVLHAADAPVRIALAGDSTVTDSAGWGLAFAKLVGPDARVENFAKGGASTKSFGASYWKKVIASKPQWVLIQFGHNDQPGKGPERETDPKTTYRENLARFVDEARAVGAQPIIVTSLTRRIFGPDGKITSSLEPYAEGARAVAAEKKVPLVDLHTRSIELCNKLGKDEAKKFGPKHPKIEGEIDGTHLNEQGAAANAALVADELKKVAPDLAKLLK
jgi:lysophospholipase L1-like esterase